MVIALWLFGAFFVTFVFGTARTIGFWSSFLLSLLLSPFLGFIFCLVYETKEKATDTKKMIELQEQNNQLLRELKNKTP